MLIILHSSTNHANKLNPVKMNPTQVLIILLVLVINRLCDGECNIPVPISIIKYSLFPGLPFLITSDGRSYKEFNQPDDNWNVTSVPRSISPVVENQNHTHSVPKPLSQEDRDLLLRLTKVKDSEEARAMWYDADSLMQYPPFVDKALKLFNLKQVAHEIETSVMSKVSCTACRTGKSSIFHESTRR